jgi:hypothetical protein
MFSLIYVFFFFFDENVSFRGKSEYQYELRCVYYSSSITTSSLFSIVITVFAEYVWNTDAI